MRSMTLGGTLSPRPRRRGSSCSALGGCRCRRCQLQLGPRTESPKWWPLQEALIGTLQPFTCGTPKLADGLQEERARGAHVVGRADQLLRSWLSKFDVGPGDRAANFQRNLGGKFRKRDIRRKACYWSFWGSGVLRRLLLWDRIPIRQGRHSGRPWRSAA